MIPKNRYHFTSFFTFFHPVKGRGRRGKDASGASLDATHLIASDGRHPKGALTVGFPTCRSV